jgi:hypothetical protein
MKKRFITGMSVVLIVMLFFGAINALAIVTPNFATNTHNENSIYYYGYVQCQPSYVENGYHAARGYIRYWRYDIFGNVVEDTNRLYTSYGNGPDDSRILTKTHTFIDSIIPNPNKTQFRYGFTWVPDGTGIWPVSIPIDYMTE